MFYAASYKPRNTRSYDDMPRGDVVCARVNIYLFSATTFRDLASNRLTGPIPSSVGELDLSQLYVTSTREPARL